MSRNALRTIVIALIVLCVIGIVRYTIPVTTELLQQPTPTIVMDSVPYDSQSWFEYRGNKSCDFYPSLQHGNMGNVHDSRYSVMADHSKTISPPTVTWGMSTTAVTAPVITPIPQTVLIGSPLVASLLVRLNQERARANLPVFSSPHILGQVAANAVKSDSSDANAVIQALEAQGMLTTKVSLYGASGSTDAEQIFTSWWSNSNFKAEVLNPENTLAAVGMSGNQVLLIVAAVPTMTAPGAGVSQAGTADSQEADITALVNMARQSEGLPILKINPILTQVALLHSQDQAQQKILSHEGSDGSDVSERVYRIGYNFTSVGENVLKQPWIHAASAFNSWWNSPGHHDNMMHPGFTEIGIAYSQDTEGYYYYTMVLTTPR